MHAQVALWEACIMGAVYVAYVVVTFYVSRHEEPVHADVALHEVPQEEGIGERLTAVRARSRAAMCSSFVQHALRACSEHACQHSQCELQHAQQRPASTAG